MNQNCSDSSFILPPSSLFALASFPRRLYKGREVALRNSLSENPAMHILTQMFTTWHAFIIVPMLGMSVVAITLVIWRVMLNRNARTDLNAFLPQLQERLAKDG